MKAALIPACIIATVAFAASLVLPSAAQDQDYTKLLASLPASRLTLADGLAYVRAPGVPISAKFELADTPAGQLSLSVYVAPGGLKAGVKGNHLEELAGDPTTAPWKPTPSPLVGGDLSDGVDQLAIVEKSRLSLADVYKRAKAYSGGNVISIVPSSRQGKDVFAVRVVQLGAVWELFYDLKGKLLAKAD